GTVGRGRGGCRSVGEGSSCGPRWGSGGSAGRGGGAGRSRRRRRSVGGCSGVCGTRGGGWRRSSILRGNVQRSVAVVRVIVVAAARVIKNQRYQGCRARGHYPDGVSGGDILAARFAACILRRELRRSNTRPVGGVPYDRVPAARVGVFPVVCGVRRS